jgi:endonuclease/exonuclease/phosphatase (EEP) superfamily protein YafD
MNQSVPLTKSRSPLSISGLVEVGSMLLCAASIAGFLARIWWCFELAAHFRLHLALGLALMSAIWAIKRRWGISLACMVGAAANGALVLHLFLSDEPVKGETTANLRLVSLNVQTENEQRETVLRFLQNANADVILLMEVNAAWMQALEPLRTNFSEVLAEPREDNFGIAIFSRLPLTNSQILNLGGSDVPSIAITLAVAGQTVFFLGTHPLPPGSPENAQLRNAQLHEIAMLIHTQSVPAMVAGDLNCTPGSPYFDDLLSNSGLKNVSPHCGLFGSWPAWLPCLRIPLDHGLVSPAIRVIDKHMGPPVGSDHLPLIMDVQIGSSR